MSRTSTLCHSWVCTHPYNDIMIKTALIGKRSEEKGDAFVRSDDSNMVRTPREEDEEENDYDQDEDGFNP